MLKTKGLQLHSSGAAVAKSPPGRSVEPPLDIVPISVRSPSSKTAKLPSEASEGEGKKHFGSERDEDLLLVSAELAAGAISSVLWDSDLKRADAMPIEEVLALSLQGAATVSPDSFICSFHRFSELFVNFISFLQMATYMKSLARRVSQEASEAMSFVEHLIRGRRSSEVGGLGQLEGRGDCRAKRRGLYLVGL